VSLDGSPVRGLPIDPSGRSYQDLAASEHQWQTRVPLVRDAGGGQHVLTLSVAKVTPPGSTGQRCTVDGFSVASTGTRGFPTGTVIPLALALVVSLGLLARDLKR